VSEVVGFDRTIGITIASCSYVGTEMEKEQAMQQILEMLKAMQEKADAVRNVNRAKATKQEDMLTEMNARMDANTKEMNAKMDANQAKGQNKRKRLLT
jgi:hypothetical protein